MLSDIFYSEAKRGIKLVLGNKIIIDCIIYFFIRFNKRTCNLVIETPNTIVKTVKCVCHSTRYVIDIIVWL